jgi:hypothetical protein
VKLLKIISIIYQLLILLKQSLGIIVPDVIINRLMPTHGMEEVTLVEFADLTGINVTAQFPLLHHWIANVGHSEWDREE